MKKVNSYWIKISGTAELPNELPTGRNYKLILDGSLEEVTLKDNHDETYDQYYKFKPVLVSAVNETGESIKAKDTRSQSKLMRDQTMAIWLEKRPNIEFDDFYERLMRLYRSNADVFVEKIIKELNL